MDQVVAGRVSEPMIRSAYEFNNVIFTAARLPQIIQNYQVGDSCTPLALCWHLGPCHACHWLSSLTCLPQLPAGCISDRRPSAPVLHATRVQACHSCTGPSQQSAESKGPHAYMHRGHAC